MSKNTLSTTYRKVDVDEFSEDKFEEDVIEDASQGPSESEVNGLLSQSKNEDALRCVLDNAPVLSKSVEAKERAWQLVMRVLSSFKSSSIEGVVKSLTPQQIDMLMKYIYKSFECPSDETSKQLLVWHEKVFAVGGLGSIVRVLTDRKKVA